MAERCMLCDKKIGFFKSFGEDILTGNPQNKICSDCFGKVDLLIKKSEMKIPFKPDDFEGMSEDGKGIVLEYLKETEDFIDEIEFDEELSQEDVMDREIGEAIIDRTFEIDEEETSEIFEKIKAMREEEISDFLDPLVSEHDAADSFMREIKALTNEELKEVIADQREYFNNAEWAYILYVDDFRKFIENQKNGITEETEKVLKEVPENIDEEEIARMSEVFKNHSKEELEEIINDGGYTFEARTAAENLLKKLS